MAVIVVVIFLLHKIYINKVTSAKFLGLSEKFWWVLVTVTIAGIYCYQYIAAGSAQWHLPPRTGCGTGRSLVSAVCILVDNSKKHGVIDRAARTVQLYK